MAIIFADICLYLLTIIKLKNGSKGCEYGNEVFQGQENQVFYYSKSQEYQQDLLQRAGVVLMLESRCDIQA